MAGYVRQSSAEIVDTLTIDAVDLNNEFDLKNAKVLGKGTFGEVKKCKSNNN